ncbi:MAG: hypothetical protein OXH58_06120 [Acidimicrobiaceae bacterium]|nr:hypothetical protein [Acidimicrobiaceae bacterium]
MGRALGCWSYVQNTVCMFSKAGIALRTVIIGAGSANFSMHLVREVAGSEALAGEVCLVDADRERLGEVEKLCVRLLGELDSPTRVLASTERRSFLEGADLVVCTALAGGREAILRGHEVARRHGYRFGGSFWVMHDESFWSSLRQLALFDEIAEDILELCPSAWLLQVANPVIVGMSRLGQAYPSLKAVGLCDGPSAFRKAVDGLGFKGDRVSVVAPGVNHFVWLTALTVDGVDRTDEFVSRARSLRDELVPGVDHPDVGDAVSLRALYLTDLYGRFPVGDTHLPYGGGWPWWLYDEASLAAYGDPEAVWEDFERWLQDERERVVAVARDPAASVVDEFPVEPYRLEIGEAMEALAGAREIEMPVNVMNRHGLVVGVPAEIAVEIPARLSRDSVAPVGGHDLGGALTAAILRDYAAPTLCLLDAYTERSRDRLVDLVAMDRNTRNRAQAAALVSEVLALPENRDLAEAYR